jgi:hypothetical protein
MLPMQLSVLRDIGWEQWDPVRLNGSEGGWRRSNAADEYDRYLVQVAGRLRNGEPDNVLVDYLVGIETGHMGLPDSPTARLRAEMTVAAIRERVEGFN